MAQTSITLTASMRSNLSSLKSIQSQMDKTQERLSTGKKVNSAIDNSSSFYQARSLTNRAADLEGLLDSMGQGIQTIQAANEGIEAVTAFVEQLKSIANSAFALDPSDPVTYENSIDSYKNQYNKILDEITNVVEDASYQGVNLLAGNELTVTFNETRTNRFTITGNDIVERMGLGEEVNWTSVAETKTVNVVTEDAITVAEADEDAGTAAITVAKGEKVYTDGDETTPKYYVMADDGNYYEYDVENKTLAAGATAKDPDDVSVEEYTEEVATGVNSYKASIDQTLDDLSEAVDYLRSYATELGNNYSIIETRQDFTDALIDVLETGADDLVLADMNEESANYLALQTRQQLAVNSLSLASQSAQSVLSLF